MSIKKVAVAGIVVGVTFVVVCRILNHNNNKKVERKCKKYNVENAINSINTFSSIIANEDNKDIANGINALKEKALSEISLAWSIKDVNKHLNVIDNIASEFYKGVFSLITTNDPK